MWYRVAICCATAKRARNRRHQIASTPNRIFDLVQKKDIKWFLLDTKSQIQQIASAICSKSHMKSHTCTKTLKGSWFKTCMTSSLWTQLTFHSSRSLSGTPSSRRGKLVWGRYTNDHLNWKDTEYMTASCIPRLSSTYLGPTTSMIREIYIIEYAIADSSDKLPLHLKIWDSHN
jgi:hypothetical protein